MTSRLIPYEIGYIEEDDLPDEGEEFFCCPKCEQRFLARIEPIGEQAWKGDKPLIELLLCEDCLDSFGPSNLFFLWLDWNKEGDTIH